jgi:hypothetical protein
LASRSEANWISIGQHLFCTFFLSRVHVQLQSDISQALRISRLVFDSGILSGMLKTITLFAHCMRLCISVESESKNRLAVRMSSEEVRSGSEGFRH